MNILVFSWRDQKHPFAGGSELNLFSQVDYWVKWGHHVTIFTASFPGAESHESRPGIDIVRRGSHYTVYLWAAVYYFWKLRKKTDVILDIMNIIPFFTPLYSRKKKIVLVHHISPEQIYKELPRPLNHLVVFLQIKIFPLVYRKTRIISVSESTREALQKLGLGAKAITVIHNGVEHRKLHPTRKKTDYPSIIYLGRLKKYKQIELLIDQFTDVIASEPTAQLFIVGAGDELTALKNRVANKNLREHVTFKGFVSEKEKIDLLSQAWIFITPSLVEGWGLSVIEANACGTPAIAFDVPGLDNSIKNGTTGFLVQNGHEMKEKTILLVKNSGLRTAMSEQAIEWAKQFDWKKSAWKTVDQFTSL